MRRERIEEVDNIELIRLSMFVQDNSFMHTAEKPGEGSVLTRQVWDV